MKVICLILFATLAFANIDTLINTILTIRDGASDTQVKSAPNPFELISSEDNNKIEKIQPRFDLQAIFDSGALINDHWVKLGSIIDGYKVESIDAQSVKLQNGKNQKILYLKPRTTF